MEELTENETGLLNAFYKNEIFIPEENILGELILRGGFEQKILFLTNGEGVPTFKADIESMFQRMIANLKSNENEIGIIDLKKNPVSFSLLKKLLKPESIIFCGIKPVTIGLQIETEKNKVITMNDCKILITDSFSELHHSEIKRKEIFPSLKKIFSL